jgi:hypothetical protein
MAEALRFEKADEHGNPIKRLKTPNPATARPLHPPARPQLPLRPPMRSQLPLRQAKKLRVDTTVDVPNDILLVSSGDNDEDPNYEGTTECTSPEDSEYCSTDTDWPGEYDTYEMMLLPPSNAEVCFCLVLFFLTLTPYY